MHSTSPPHQEPITPSTDPPNPCLEQLNALEEAVLQLEKSQALLAERANALLDCRIQMDQASKTAQSLSLQTAICHFRSECVKAYLDGICYYVKQIRQILIDGAKVR